MKIVIVGSFKNKNNILKKREEFLEQGNEVFPDEQFFDGGKPIILAHHFDKVPLSPTLLKMLAERERIYLREISKCSEVYVMNEKDGEEHIGLATAIEIGFALALGKMIIFEREPSDQHVKIIHEGLLRV